MVKQGNIKNGYLLASFLMLIFVLFDLLFDFLFSFTGSNYVSFTFTILASILTFMGNYGVVKFEITHKTDKISVFIRSVFNLPQIIFSILDIFCGIVSIISGLVVVGSIFKIVKVLFIPARFVTVANKGKTIFKAISNFSLVWVIGRLFTNSFKGGIMVKTWIKNNKETLASLIISTPVAVALVFFTLNMFFELQLWSNILIGIAVAVINCAWIVKLGGDKVLQAQFRAFSFLLDEENRNKLKIYGEKLLDDQKLKEEIHKMALQQIADREKQKATEVEQISAQQKQALIDAEIAKIESANK